MIFADVYTFMWIGGVDATVNITPTDISNTYVVLYKHLKIAILFLQVIFYHNHIALSI